MRKKKFHFIGTLNNLTENWHEINWLQGKLIGVLKLIHF